MHYDDGTPAQPMERAGYMVIRPKCMTVAQIATSSTTLMYLCSVQVANSTKLPSFMTWLDMEQRIHWKSVRTMRTHAHCA
jgi:hypothetical protein